MNDSAPDGVNRVIVCCIDGRPGASVARAFSSLPNTRVRGLTNKPHAEIREKWAARAVDIIEVDYTDHDALAKIFKHATIIVGITSFWNNMYDHSVHTLASLTQHPPVVLARNNQLTEGLNIVRAAAGVVSLERYVHYMYPDVGPASGGTITGAYHFEVGAKVANYVVVNLPDLWAKTSMCVVGVCIWDWHRLMRRVNAHEDADVVVSVENQGGGGLDLEPDSSMGIDTPSEMRRDNSLTLGSSLPGHIPVPWVHPEDIGRFVVPLATTLPPRTAIQAYSGLASFFDICALVEQATGVHISSRQYSAAELTALFGPVGSMLFDQWTFIERHRYYHENVKERTELANDYGVHIQVEDITEFLKRDGVVRVRQLLGEIEREGVDDAREAQKEFGVEGDNGSATEETGEAMEEDDPGWWTDYVNWPPTD